MLCIRQNQSSSFNGPISHSSSVAANLDSFQPFNCDEDFQDINLADFSIDVPLDDSLDQMFNNQQSTFDSIGLASGYSTPTSSSLSTSTPTPTSTPIPTGTGSAATNTLPVQLIFHHHRSSSGLSFSETTSSNISHSANPDNIVSNNNRGNNRVRNTCNESLILSNNQGSLIESAETSLSSAPTTPSSATLPSFMEIYSPRNFPQQSTSQQQPESGLNSVTDDGSFFKFDEIADLNDDNTVLSNVSFGSVSLQKPNQASEPLIDLSFVKQEPDDGDIMSISPLQSTLIQSLHHQHHQQHTNYHHVQHRHNQPHQYRSHQDNSPSRTHPSSVASSLGYIALSPTKSIPNPDYYQQPMQYQQPLQQQSQYQHPHSHYLQHLHQMQYPQHAPQSIPRPYLPLGIPLMPNTMSPESDYSSTSIEQTMRSQMNISRSSLPSSSLILGSNSNNLGLITETSSDRSSPISRSKLSKASIINNGSPRTFETPSPGRFTPLTPPTPKTSPGFTTPPRADLFCAVCGDNAACQHYGVRTCEGCKGFFKRTVQKGSKYVCLGSKDCPVDKRRRNRCQFCRFQKCLAVGMVKEVVRTDSLKGRRGRLPSKPKSTQESSPSPPVSLITAIVRAHVDSCPDISNLDLNQYCEISEEEAFNVTQESFNQFINLLLSSINSVKSFTNKVPGYSDLHEKDQEMLFLSACFEIISLRMAYLNKPGSKKIILPNGVVLHRNQAKLLFGSWFTNIELFSSRFAQIDIDISAFACLSGLSLITVRHGLVDPVRVEGLQMKIIESLRDHVTYNAEAQKKSHYFSSILSKLPDLRTLSMVASTHLHEIKLGFRNSFPETLTRFLNNALDFI